MKVWLERRFLRFSKLEKTIIKLPATIPRSKLKNIQVLTAFMPVFLFSNANFSETIQVTAIFKPEVATVIKNKYTLI